MNIKLFLGVAGLRNKTEPSRTMSFCLIRSSRVVFKNCKTTVKPMKSQQNSTVVLLVYENPKTNPEPCLIFENTEILK